MDNTSGDKLGVWRDMCLADALVVCFFVRSTISQQPAGRFTPSFACGRSLVRDVSSPLLGVSDPLGGKKGGNEIRVVSFLNRTATIFVYLSVTKCGRICRAHTPAHILVWNRKNSPRGFYRVGQKSRKYQFFSRILRLYVHISQQRLK